VAEVVNLRRARKAKAKRAQDRAADAQRLKHGLSRQEREAAKAQRLLEEKRIDGHHVSDPADE